MSAHANCTHPATKSARAACRRQSGVVKPATVTVADVKVEEPTSLAFEWDPSRSQGYFNGEDEWVSMGGTIIDRSCWKGYRHMVMEMEIEAYGVNGNHTVYGKIIAWGEKYMTYVSAVGARNRVEAARVLRVFVA